MVPCRDMGTVPVSRGLSLRFLSSSAVPVLRGLSLRLSFLFSVSILLFILFLSSLQAQTRQAYIRGVCVEIEVVNSPQGRSRGLMFKDKLGEKEGMLFIFEERGRHNFWMKNMRFPLDIIWISQDKVIVDIRKNIPVCQDECPSYTPQVNALYVLEVNAGFVDKNKIGIGDTVRF